MTGGSVQDIAWFAEALRERGLTVTPDQMSDMARALLLVDLTSRDQVYNAMRSLAITDPAHRIPYDEEFQRFFEHSWFTRRRDSAEGESQRFAVTPLLERDGAIADDETNTREGTSAVESLAERDFADLDPDELAEAKRLIANMTWSPSDFRTRRWQRDSTGQRPDMRRTMKQAVGPEGDLMRIEMRKRRMQQRPLIMITDISGSMERYSDVFMVFAHAAKQRLRHVEAFTFSTKLTRITPDLEKRDPTVALSGVSEVVSDWSGGTKIGEALASWNKTWSRRLARGRPIVLVLSDGWDCGDPDLLSTEMARMARSVAAVFWLNPLAARAEYEPATRGMRAVMPHVDELLPAASINDLREVIRLLESTQANS